VRFLEAIEKKGVGWNLSLQVLDGILCHNGEVHNPALYPDKDKDFARLEQDIKKVIGDPNTPIWPMTMEGCVVRMADTISYIGRDIEDAIRLGLIKRNEMPRDCRRILGETNGTIVYTLVEDLIAESLARAKNQTDKLKLMFEMLFNKYYNDLKAGNDNSVIFKEFLDGMSSQYRDATPLAMIVRDFISGMTDDYFLRQCQENLMPQILSGRYENI